MDAFTDAKPVDYAAGTQPIQHSAPGFQPPGK
jgi:hypothetical protein